MTFRKHDELSNSMSKTIVPALLISILLLPASAMAQDAMGMDASATMMGGETTAPVEQPPAQGNSMTASETGTAINGDANGSNVNNNQNNLSTGNNTNMNVLNPTVLAPSQTAAMSSGGMGGNSVLMLPRNPLPMPNALAGRSNFGVQFGLQNNPILGGLGGLGGRQNALGWFMQAGVTIPFGKIPDVFRNPQMARLDDQRQQQLSQERNVLGRITPNSVQDGMNYEKHVKGKISGMGAYNYATLPFSKINLPEGGLSDAESIKAEQPKLLALAAAEVYSKPLHVGEKIGQIVVGNEYPYLGHTKSGWVKVILPDGKQGWTSSHFEYIKHDFTEIDSLAIAPPAPGGSGKGDKVTTRVSEQVSQAKPAEPAIAFRSPRVSRNAHGRQRS